MFAAVMLLGAHFGAWFLADEIILAEIPGQLPLDIYRRYTCWCKCMRLIWHASRCRVLS